MVEVSNFKLCDCTMNSLIKLINIQKKKIVTMDEPLKYG